jgi:hypothetical protein
MTEKQMSDDEIQNRFEEINAMARELADEAVRLTIEGGALLEFIGGETWFNTDCSTLRGCGTLRNSLELAFRYAEARNLLRHHPTRPNLVQIVEVPE